MIGLELNPNGISREPLSGRIGNFLSDLCGIAPQEYHRRFTRVNVRPDPERARSMMAGQPCVVFGRKAARMLGLTISWYRVDASSKVVVVPHPSGRNRLYNLPAHRHALKRILLHTLRTTR